MVAQSRFIMTFRLRSMGQKKLDFNKLAVLKQKNTNLSIDVLQVIKFT